MVHLGDSHYKVLRSGAMRALRADRKGAKLLVMSDPEAWSVLQTIRDARDLGNPSQVEAMLGLFAQGGDGLPTNGPTAVLLARLVRLGCAIGGQGLVQDRFGSFSLLHLAWDELLLRFKLSWGSVLAAEVSHRPTFNGIEHVDLPELHRALQQFGPVDQVYLRCHLDGTLFTQNGRAKFDTTVSAKCPWCPAKDGFHHRAWECPHFAPCRSHFTSEQLGVIDTFPSCLIDHGWPLVLPEWEVFVGFLLTADGLSRMSPVVPPVASDVAVELFMDGTGAFPREPKLRYAAWAVTLVPGGVGTLDNHLILGGHVGGICQTSYRAELTAVLAAIQWATERGQSVHLWGDCQGVVTGVRRLLRGLPLKRNRPHSDLWERLESLLGTMDTRMVQICKVVSHGQIAMATGPLEEWAYWHNQLTDLAAAEIKPFQVPNDEVNVVVPQSWTVPAKLVQRYGHVNMQHLHDWWSQSGTSMLQGDGQLVFISGIQIFMAFNLCTQYPGPWCHKKRWYASEQDAPVAARVLWGARCQWFLRMWKSYVKANQVLIPTRMTRPCSASVARWTVCYLPHALE